MLFRFIGQYTGGRTSICMGGVMFEGEEPAEVICPDMVSRLSRNQEFEAVPLIDAEPVGDKAPRRRGRPKKDQD